MPEDQQRRLKSRRVTRACDYCHHRSIRCVRRTLSSHCQNCLQFDQPCTFNRQMKRRGAKPKQVHSARNATSATPQNAEPSTSTRSSQLASSASRESWRSPVVATQATVVDLVEIYFEIVYPIFPLFHRPTYFRKISRGDYSANRNLFATTMAMCALTSARVRDQALFNPSWDAQDLTDPPSEKFYDAAVQALDMEDTTQTLDLNLLRAFALLALTSIQYGRIRDMQAYLGRYHTLVAMDGLHNETNWPQDIGIVETEERRRLFWSMYTLDVYASIIWNGVTRVRDQQINVAYPTELDDELFNDRGYRQRPTSPVNIGPSPCSQLGEVGSDSWLCGWNFTTDLYRIMEHVITNLRGPGRGRKSVNELFGEQPSLSESSIREGVMQFYRNLPQCFKECPEVTCDMSSDRYGFQAANITATVQLLRMLLFSSRGGIEDRCKIASEVVEAFSHIPVAYLRAISSPLLHHLTGIGTILGSVFEDPITDMEYQQVRVVLLALAQLLENLDHSTHSAPSAERLRNLVARIDGYMKSCSEQLAQLHELTSQYSGQTADQVNSQAYGPEVPQTIPSQFTSDFFEEWLWTSAFPHKSTT